MRYDGADIVQVFEFFCGGLHERIDIGEGIGEGFGGGFADVADAEAKEEFGEGAVLALFNPVEQVGDGAFAGTFQIREIVGG